MSLNTVPERRVTQRKQLNQTNNISDIAGARPKKLIRDVRKPNFHETSDIHGTRPKRLIPQKVNRPQFTNSTADIEGAQALRKRASNRVVDPLNPVYQLPAYKAKPVTPPKFYGDRSLDISDISGTKPRNPKKASGRDINNIDDIVGASTSYNASKLKRRDPPKDPNDVSDIMSTGFKTTRTTNGLNPTYVVNGMRIEDDPGMKPKQLIRQRRDNVDFHSTSDIEGANSHYKFRKLANRRTFRNPVAIDDIPGAGADSVRNQLRTKRVTDPNNPQYTSLCGAALGTVTKPNTPDPRKSSFFASLDADGDGKVTYQELLEAADHNKDGNLTVAELHKFAKGKISNKELTKLLRSADKNNDGVISAQEGTNVGTSLANDIASNQNDADEIDKLRQELDTLRREEKLLASAPLRKPTPSSVKNSSRTSTARRRATPYSAKPTPPRTSGSTASRRGETMRARRERVATAQEIDAVRNLP